jgi:hypothetical protein
VLSPANIVLGLQFVTAIALICLLAKRRAFLVSPIFMAYIIYSVISTAVQWVCLPDQQLYFKAYWLTEAGDIILAVAATCESFISTFRGFFALSWFRWVLPLLAGLVAIYATWKAIMHPPVLNSPLVAIVVGVEIFLRYFIAGVFITHLIGRRIWRVSILRFQYNILLGFFLSSCGMLFAAMLRSEFGTEFRLAMEWAQPVAYSAALFVWLFSAMTWQAKEEQRLSPEINADFAFLELGGYSSVLKKARK